MNDHDQNSEHHDSRRSKKAGRYALAFLGVLILIALLGFVVMFLWNQTIAAMFDLSPISYWQALGLFLLAKLFFGMGGGRRGGRGWRHGKHRGRGQLSQLARQQDFKEFWEKEGKQAYEEFLTARNNKDEQTDARLNHRDNQ